MITHANDGFAIDSKACEFQFNQDIAAHIVRPLVVEQFGKQRTVFFDWDAPAVSERGNNQVDLVVDASKIVSGKRLMYENDFVIVLDKCTHEVVKTYILDYSGTGAN